MSALWIVLAILLLVALMPAWPYSRGWGYGPSGLGMLLLIIVLLVLFL